jgi:Domain of unknown function (DUF4389)
MDAHPVQLVVEDDLRRNRLTVFFRLLLAIPHFIWITLWTIAVVVAAIANWFATLFAGRPPALLHRFLSSYVRYTVQLNAYLHLVANPYPGFLGEEGEYEVDVRLPREPVEQVRWTTFFRLILAVPALFLSVFLGGVTGPSLNVFILGGARRRSRTGGSGGFGGVLTAVCALLGWFAALALGRMPRGLRDAGAYGIGYGAQVLAYVLLLTDRYPNADPTAMLDSVERPPAHPVHLVGDAHDLRRSRLTVFFRLPLLIPHLVWLYLWTIAAVLLGIVNWFATLFTGMPPRAFHRFLSAYVRYQLHVYAFGSLAANPFPGFTGAAGTYPLDLALPGAPQRQSRWKTAFRILLVIPAWIVGAVLTYTLYAAAILTWFVALIRGSAPWGLRNLSAYALRYLAQVNAYLYLLTDMYPHASPLEGEHAQEEPSQLEPAPQL